MTLRASLVLVFFGAVLLAPCAFAGGGPENCLVVVNGDVPESVTVAQEYVQLRQIPAGNVVTLSGLPADPKITVAVFREKILAPVLQAMDERGLRSQIDYLVYSCGFPYAVDVSQDMAGRQFPRVVTQPASLTGLTYLYDLVQAGNTGYLDLDSNWYARPLKRQYPAPALTASEASLQTRLQALLDQAEKARREAAKAQTPPPAEMTQWLQEAVTILRTLVAGHPRAAELLYDLACVLALQGQPEEAMAALQTAYDSGWWNASLTERDTDLTSLRERPDFKALLEKMRQVVVESEPPVPFASSRLWPSASAPERPGRKYLLSAMLGYVGPAANTLPEILACLRRARAADGTCPAGTVYYMASTDWARTGPRQWAFPSAVEALGKLGVKGEALPGNLPPQKADVAGAMIGLAGFKWADSGSTLLPGAFCDHLTSFGGIMTGVGQTVLSEFLRHGAAGACGTVTEPYNTPVKFPTAFVHVYYAAGCSLGEAFYQSVKAPYQQLLVGDPLCQPWAKPPAITVTGLKLAERVGESRWLTPAGKADRFELYVDGVLRHKCAGGRRLRLDLTGLAPGPHEARVVGVSGPLETRGRTIIPFLVDAKER